MRGTEVLIIESRAPDDHFHGRQEGRALRDVLAQAEIKAEHYEVLTQGLLISALAKVSREAIKYVHISCHGSPDGFSLTDDTFISWAEFDQLAWPRLKGKCLVFSSCEVGRGVRRLFDLHATFCSAIVAPTREITWAEGLVAYSAFYLRALSNGTTERDVTIMNHIVGRGTFVLYRSKRGGPTYMFGM